MEAIQTLHEIRHRLQVAEKAGDTESFVQMMADDIVLMVSDQPVQQGKDARGRSHHAGSRASTCGC